MDIRQESTRHSDAIQELTNYLDLSIQYDQMSEKERIKWLIDELNTKRPLIPSEVNWNKSTEETFSVFKMVKRLQEEFGSRICHSYVISMSHSASDLLEVLLLAKEMGLVDQGSQKSKLLVVPLFETVEDLKRAPEVMEQLFKLDFYRSLLP